MRQDSKFLVVVALFACVSLVACGDDGNSSGPEGGESSVAEESSSSLSLSSSDSEVTEVIGDTTKITCTYIINSSTMRYSMIIRFINLYYCIVYRKK
jgi:uncharacterized lipoprotein YehR (DUF1307 family)